MEGGVADFTRLLGTALAALGAEVHILTSTKATDMNSKDAKAMKSAKTNPQSPIPNLHCHPLMRSWGWRPLYTTVGRLLGELRPDVVNIQYQTAAFDMRPAINLLPSVVRYVSPRALRSHPFVVTFHDLLVPYLFPKAGRIRWGANLALARACQGVIVTNTQDQERLGAYPWMPRLELIPIGSNIPCVLPDRQVLIHPTNVENQNLSAGYDRAKWRERWGIGDDTLLLCYFGFLNASKGGEELIAALDSLCRSGRRASLLMIGGAVGASDPTNQTYLELVKRSIRERGLEQRVIWTGYMSPEEVSASFLSADVCVLPYRDGASFRRGSFMAALAHGMPIVTTQPQGIISQLRDGENILLVPPQDPQALSAAVARVANDMELRQRLSAGAQALSKEFDWGRIAARTLEVYHALAGR